MVEVIESNAYFVVCFGGVNPFRTASPGFGDKPVKFQVLCPPNGTAVLKGSRPEPVALGVACAARRSWCQSAFFFVTSFMIGACMHADHTCYRRDC